MPNAALLGAFAALSGLVSVESVQAAIGERFPAEVAEGNAAAARAAYDLTAVPSQEPARRAAKGTDAGPAPAREAGGQGAARQIEGSKAVAAAVAACRPEVICAYPISPQTHIVEALIRAVGNRARWPLRVRERRVRVRRPCRWPSGRPGRSPGSRRRSARR